jgi:crossover junction endodeoxyribonuclease RuvC
MTAVVGIDLSLTATGLCKVWVDEQDRLTAHGRTLATKGRRDDTLLARAERLDGIVDEVTRFADDADLVVIEGPAFTRQGGSNWDRAGLWWAVIRDVMGFFGSRPIAVVGPTVLKKWATSRGNADKAAVAVGVARLWDFVEIESDNEADALGLASMGAQKVGLPVPRRAHHAACLAKVEWPVNLPVSDADRAAIAEDTLFDRSVDAAEGRDT